VVTERLVDDFVTPRKSFDEETKSNEERTCQLTGQSATSSSSASRASGP
jgi:hypothetical protein